MLFLLDYQKACVSLFCMLTLDIWSNTFYTILFIFKWIEFTKWALNSLNKNPTKILNRFFFILTWNSFFFNGMHYLQKIGCAMATICAANYDNVFMRKFQRTSLSLSLYIYIIYIYIYIYTYNRCKRVRKYQKSVIVKLYYTAKN